MKLQSLAIIFIIIILPITMVLSTYVETKIKTVTTELEYDTKLLNSTYDSIKAYQLNTINNEFGDVTNSKISDIEAAVNTFYNSLANNFNFTGYKAGIMKEYVPAVAFTLYDGYYIYSPFNNTLTGVDISTDDGDPVDYDEDYSEPNKITNGLKPYVYYSARYKMGGNSDFVINYTLDNYITIMGIINGKYVYDCGYLYSIANSLTEADQGKGIYRSGSSYSFGGVTFKENDSYSEELKEYVGDKQYCYAKINGKKYYLEEDINKNMINVPHNGKTISINANARFFYIDNNGKKNYNEVLNYDISKDSTYSDNDVFIKFYLAITKNKSAYVYYKRAYEFSKAVLGMADSNYKDKANTSQSGGYNLSGLKASDSVYWSQEDADSLKQAGIISLKEYGDYNIFDGNMHFEDSNFNKHRKSIIRYVIETNMSTAISGFSSSAKTDFIMPKISDEYWEMIQNDVCEISFLQGLNLGNNKKYNGYSVVSNMLTKEYVDEDDIYILTTDNTYCKANDKNLKSSNIVPKATNGYYSGIWKVNFERRKFIHEDTGAESFYYPLSFDNGTNIESYLGSYTSIMGNSGIKGTEIGTSTYPDMYRYIIKKSSALKKAYFYALGRERWGSYNVNNINYELYGSNEADKYFLKDY